MPANRKPRYEKLLDDEALAEWNEAGPGLGEMLGFYRYLNLKLDADDFTEQQMDLSLIHI